jgi:hypothetical protein
MGFAMQSFFRLAPLASKLPLIFYSGVDNTLRLGVIPDQHPFTWVELLLRPMDSITSKEYLKSWKLLKSTQKTTFKEESADWYITNGHSLD